MEVANFCGCDSSISQSSVHSCFVCIVCCFVCIVCYPICFSLLNIDQLMILHVAGKVDGANFTKPAMLIFSSLIS
uniref:Uncharacterized protein n=1 Tax=Hordeum vulgare subsp. vulgare TaxID=112509 RepID=A0A8I6Y1P5_HORVV